MLPGWFFAYRVGWLDFTASCWSDYSPERSWLDYFEYLPNQKGELIAIDIRDAWLRFGVRVNKYEILPDPRVQSELINELKMAPLAITLAGANRLMSVNTLGLTVRRAHTTLRLCNVFNT